MTKRTLPLDLPPSDEELMGQVACHQCSKQALRSRAVIGCINLGNGTIQEHFCSMSCRDKWKERVSYRPIICVEQ